MMEAIMRLDKQQFVESLYFCRFPCPINRII